jgi:hypothetical protein
MIKIKFTKLLCRKKRGEEDPFGMTAALDQLAFTQDIVMMDDLPPKGPTGTMTMDMSKGGIQTQPQPATGPPSYTTVMTTPMTAEIQMMAGTATVTPVLSMDAKKTPPSTAQTRPSTTTSTPAKGIPEKTFSDPLRDLILLSEVILIDDEDAYINKVKFFAEDSSCLEHVVEVNSKDSYIQIQQQMRDQLRMKELSQPFDGMALFQNPKEVVDPIKEAEFLKTLEALEDTDDSDAVEKPVLGKISLVRRAKSAATRSSSDKRKQEDHPILHQVAWDEIDVNFIVCLFY